MTPNNLITAFDTLADAPHGVKRLRELVLSLAVRGSLTRSATDEWPTATLSEVVEDLQNGTSSRGGEGGPPVVVLRLADIKQGRIVPDSMREIDLSVGSSEKYRVRAGDLLAIRVNGSGDLVGRMVLVEQSEGWCYCDHLIRIRLRPNVMSPRFLSLFGETPDAREHLASVTVTTAGQKTVNQKGLGSLRVPVPPLAEQHRIVARVDELMGLLDRLEAARATRDAVRRAARDAALADLRDAPDAEAVEAAWGRIARQMDDLFTEPEDVGPLRQAVLGQAIRGRLVPTSAGTGDADGPFILPAGWRWMRLVDLTDLITSGSRNWNQYYAVEGAAFIRSQDIKFDRLEYDERAFVKVPEGSEGTRTRVEVGDWLITITGANVGKCAHVEADPGEAYVSQHVALMRPRANIAGRFGHIWLTADQGGRGTLLTDSYGAKPGLNLHQLRSLPVPVPPLAEQHRIVAKVDALMALCDTLEARLAAARDLQGQFAAAAVHHLDA